MSSLSNEVNGSKRRKLRQSNEVALTVDNVVEGGEVALTVDNVQGEEVALTVDNLVEGGEVGLKKGQWTKEEDEILVDHIKKYGEGNWKAVEKNSGLGRDGKSCRLRWLNHLRPGLNKGSFTDQEVRLILEFHFLKGGKWAQMAALLPGRTDNEIKNFWYSRYRKQERSGLPIYPDEITSKYSLNGSQESANQPSQPDEAENFKLDITDLDLKHFQFRPDMLPPYLGTTNYKLISDLVGQCSDSSHNTLPLPRAAVSSRAAVVRDRYLICADRAAVPQVFDPMLSSPCDPILNTNRYDNPPTGFHAAEPIYGSTSFELPSFQNSQNQQCTWSGMYVPPPPSFESVDTQVQAPPVPASPVQAPPVPASPDCSHLINSLLADISTQSNDEHAALITHHQMKFLRSFRSQLKTAQCYDMYRDQPPAYYTSNKQDNLNQR